MIRIVAVIIVAAGTNTAMDASAQPSPFRAVAIDQKEAVRVQLSTKQVRVIQQRLDQKGYAAGIIDGRWGPKTGAALRRFQFKRHLQTTGEVDEASLKALGFEVDFTQSLATQKAVEPGTGNPLSNRAIAENRSTRITPKLNSSVRRADAAPSPHASVSPSNPAGSGVPLVALGDNTNQAVVTTSVNALQPAHGANSFTMGEAQRRIIGSGFQDVSNLTKDDTGVWRGTATRGGRQGPVWLDYKGSIGQQ